MTLISSVYIDGKTVNTYRRPDGTTYVVVIGKSGLTIKK
jgi:hypothetical protein